MKKGFSLIELLVVIAIIGVLAGVLLVNFLGVRERAADARRKSDLVQVKKALRLYYNDYQSYPDAATLPAEDGNFTISSTTYMKEMPEYKAYDVSTDGEQFVLTVALENASDSDIADSQTKCAASIGASGISVTIDAATDFVICED